MRVPNRPRQYGLTFNITPLIDIIFLLIIFFLAASHLARSDASDKIDLPEATQSDESKDRPPRRLTVILDAEGNMSFAGQAIDLGEFERLLLSEKMSRGEEQFEVRIRGDQRVVYDKVEPIMLACARNGIRTVGFDVLQKQ